MRSFSLGIRSILGRSAANVISVSVGPLRRKGLSVSLVVGTLLLAASAHALTITTSGTFAGLPDSNLPSLSGSFSITFDITGVGDESFFNLPLDSLSLTPTVIGTTTFDTSNSVATFFFLDGAPSSSFVIGGVLNGAGSMTGATDDWAVSWDPFVDLGAPFLMFVSVATLSGIGQDSSPTGTLALHHPPPHPQPRGARGYAAAGVS